MVGRKNPSQKWELIGQKKRFLLPPNLLIFEKLLAGRVALAAVGFMIKEQFPLSLPDAISQPFATDSPLPLCRN